MSHFDIFINCFEAFINVVFLYYIFNKKNIFSASCFILLLTINTTLHNFYLLPEISLTLTTCIILFICGHYLNPKKNIPNLFLALLIPLIMSVSATIGLLIIQCFYTFPFYNGHVYIELTLIVHLITTLLFIFTSYFIKKANILSIPTIRFYSVLTFMFILGILYSQCIDFLYYEGVFNQYMISIFIFINLLSFVICMVLFESQKEQKLLIELQKKESKREMQDKITMLNQKDIAHLQRWKHDITYVFSYLTKSIKEQDYDKALQTISLFNKIISNYNFFINSSNDILNSVLIEKNDDIICNHIHIYLQTDQNDVPFNAKDYYLILDSFLTHAIKYCQSSYQNEIWISTFIKEPYFSLTFEYSCDESSLQEISKEIKDIIYNNNGIFKITYENNRDCLKILVPLEAVTNRWI